MVKGNDQTYLCASPALEFGTQFAMANGTLIRPYVRGGATIFDETDFTLKATFVGTPKGVAPFRIRTGIDDVVADVSAGVEVLDVRGASVSSLTDALATRSRRTLPAPRRPCRSSCSCKCRLWVKSRHRAGR